MESFGKLCFLTWFPLLHSLVCQSLQLLSVLYLHVLPNTVPPPSVWSYLLALAHHTILLTVWPTYLFSLHDTCPTRATSLLVIKELWSCMDLFLTFSSRVLPSDKQSSFSSRNCKQYCLLGCGSERSCIACSSCIEESTGTRFIWCHKKPNGAYFDICITVIQCQYWCPDQ